MKPQCIIGIMDNERGNAIARELFDWFSNDYIIIPLIHNGTQFEYPAIVEALTRCISTGEPTLYIHTKGAGNINPALYPSDERKYIGPECQPPDGATILDWQRTVRMMWRDEFVGNKDWYLQQCSTDTPTVAAPYVSPQKHTWTNGFMFNKPAAELVSPLEFSGNRWSYEKLWSGTACNVIGRVYNDMIGYPKMYKWKADVWKHYRP